METEQSSTGVITSRYLPDGPVKPGSFGMQPSKAELARRRRLASVEGHGYGEGRTDRRPEIYSILTVPPNEIVKPIHKKAMPIMLTTQEQADQWIDGTVDEAMQLAKPAPAEVVTIVHSGETADAA